MAGRPELERLTAEECLDLLSRTTYGEVAVSISALPAIRSVVFALVAGFVVFRVPAGSRFHLAAKGSVVAFHAAEPGYESGMGWGVEVQGFCEEVTDPAEVAELESAGLPPWQTQGMADRFLRVPLTLISGERVRWAATAIPSPQVSDLLHRPGPG
jgi:hypothetical protein